MRIYLDLCCLNRPFDDQSQARIRLESEAVVAVLACVGRRELDWIASEVISIEAMRNSDAERRARILTITSHALEMILLTPVDFARAREFEHLGCAAFDALHLSCAERGLVERFLTTDDRLLKFARCNHKLIRTEVRNPLDWVSEGLK